VEPLTLRMARGRRPSSPVLAPPATMFHALIFAAFREDAEVATPLSLSHSLPLPSHVLSDLSELDAAANERKIAENGGNPARTQRGCFRELLAGIRVENF